jgi:hypothetical protein
MLQNTPNFFCIKQYFSNGGYEDLRSSRSNFGVPMLVDMWQVGKYHVGGHMLIGSGHDKH